MPKLTTAQLTEFLQSIGLNDVQLVEDDTQADYNADSLLQAVDSSRRGIIEPQVIQSQKQSLYAQMKAAVEKDNIKFLSELSGLDKKNFDGKSHDEAVKAAIEHIKSNTASDADAQKKIDEILASHAAEKQRLESEYTSKYSELEGKYTKREILNHIVKAHKEAKGLPTNANIEKLAELFYEAKKSDVVMRINENGELALYDPKSPDTVMLNSTKTAHVGLKDLIQPHYEALGIWATDTRDVNAVTAAKNGGNNAPAAAAPAAPAMPAYSADMQQFYSQLASSGTN